MHLKINSPCFLNNKDLLEFLIQNEVLKEEKRCDDLICNGIMKIGIYKEKILNILFIAAKKALSEKKIDYKDQYRAS